MKELSPHLTYPGHPVHNLWLKAQDMGFDGRELSRVMGCDWKDFWFKHLGQARLTTYLRFVDHLKTETGDSGVLFKLAKQQAHAKEYEVLGLLSSRQANARQLLRIGNISLNSTSNSLFVALWQKDKETMLIFFTPLSKPRHVCAIIEPLLVNLKAAFEEFCPDSFLPKRIELTYPRPDHYRVLENHFQCQIAFEKPRNQVVFSSDLLNKPNQHWDKELIAYFSKPHHQMLWELARTLPGKVRSSIIRQMRQGEVSVEKTAQPLGMHPRTLQNKLREQGLSFRSEVERIRLHKALRLIINPALKLEEVAARLGFAEYSSFQKFYKSATGSNPSALRKQALG